MNIAYCDLCGVILKNNNYTLRVTKLITKDGSQKLEFDDKEMCEGCFKYMEIIFNYRRVGMEVMLREMERIFQTKAKNVKTQTKKLKPKK